MCWERRADWTTLWLPLESRGPAWAATALLAVYYLATMCRDLWFYDSAEFAIVAVQGGLSHPPGHPVYTMLGYLFSHVPAVPPLFGLNALSALPGALTVVPLTSLAETMAGPDTSSGPRWFRQRYVLPAVIATIAIHPSLWENATRIEVYALAALFSCWAVAYMACLLTAESPGERSSRWALAGLALGLSASVNPLVATITAMAVTPALLLALVRRRLRLTAVPWAVLGGLSGLLPYLYIYLVGGREDVMVWGGPIRGDLLVRYITGADFAFNKESSWSIALNNIVELFLWLGANGVLPIVVLGIAAQAIWGKRAGIGRGFVALGLLGTVYFFVIHIDFIPDVSDHRGYMSTSLWICAVGLAVMIVKLGASEGRMRLLSGVLGLVLGLSVIFAPPPIYQRTRYQDRVARLLAEGALEHAPQNAVMVVSSDHWVFPLMYLQEVEGRRPDVVVLARGLSGASWHWDRIYRQHPDLETFPLRGPGGQPARIRRFRAANPDRPVLFESWEHAAEIGRPACAGRWMLHDRNACTDDEEEATSIPDELTPALERAYSALGRGAPTAGGVLSAVSLARGVDLWRLGRPNDAVRALRAGVPPSVRPEYSGAPLPDAPPLSGPAPTWSDGRAIGHFSRNHFVAGHLLWAAGARADAQAHGSAAATAGLPEANAEN